MLPLDTVTVARLTVELALISHALELTNNRQIYIFFFYYYYFFTKVISAVMDYHELT